MRRNKTYILFCVYLAITFIGFGCKSENNSYKSGLIGIYYSEPNLTSIKAIINLKSLEQSWDEKTDFISGSSGEWNGYVMAPLTGKITFRLETNRQLIVQIGERDEISADPKEPETEHSVSMEKDEFYPISITFLNPENSDGYGYFKILWKVDGKTFKSIPAKYLFHGQKHLNELTWLTDPDPNNVDYSQFLTADAKNIMVYYKPGRFAAWPANAGIWSWGDEILVGFTQAYYKKNKYHHSFDRSKRMQAAMARSEDGGESWLIDSLNNPGNDRSAGKLNSKSIDFTNPDLAIKLSGNGYFFSQDRGKLWYGPYSYNGLGMEGITTRTDYIVNGKNDCFFFLSVKDKSVSATLQDRSFCARTLDGGKSFKFISWMAETDSIRSVMSSTVRISDTHLVTAMRRRYDSFDRQKKQLAKNYITIHQSLDNGKSWSYVSKLADTDKGRRNGNPPSMIKLADGRLCVTYGYRSVPYGIRARISSDNGVSWSKEIILRNDARNFDIGYTRTVQREDGMIVTIYYFTTDTHEEQHIAATIWDPNNIYEYQ